MENTFIILCILELLLLPFLTIIVFLDIKKRAYLDYLYICSEALKSKKLTVDETSIIYNILDCYKKSCFLSVEDTRKLLNILDEHSEKELLEKYYNKHLL